MALLDTRQTIVVATGYLSMQLGAVMILILEVRTGNLRDPDSLIPYVYGFGLFNLLLVLRTVLVAEREQRDEEGIGDS
jgi:hypothetical protein